MDANKLAALIELIVGGKINRNVGKEVFEAVFKDDVDPEQYVKDKGLMMLNDDSLVADTIDKVIADNPKSIEDLKAGKDKAKGFLVGQTMKALKGKANPQSVNQILNEKLAKILG
jgi:aspartyl-tRNA(Asn)/glutamyl-tRNA(Gln) amidotransferase subunit B